MIFFRVTDFFIFENIFLFFWAKMVNILFFLGPYLSHDMRFCSNSYDKTFLVYKLTKTHAISRNMLVYAKYRFNSTKLKIHTFCARLQHHIDLIHQTNNFHAHQCIKWVKMAKKTFLRSIWFLFISSGGFSYMWFKVTDFLR